MNILLAIDPADTSHTAVMKAITHCQGRESDCRITLMQVVPLSADVTLQKQAEALLQTAGDKLWAAGIDFDTFLVIGEPAEEILELAEAGDYDLIIMSSQEVDQAPKSHLDRVRQHVEREAACPVMVA